ncbi:MAG: wall associated protein [Arenimonas sp.]
MSGAASAQEGKAPWEEYDKLINKRKAVTTLGPQMFGDQVDLATGTLTFANTDVSVPGIGSLPVAVTRKFAIHSDKEPAGGLFGDWELDIPNISGLFAPTWHDNRCDVAAPPAMAVVGDGTSTLVPGTRYWQGNNASMPGGGELLALSSASTRPSTGGPYFWVTPGRTVFSCLGTIENGTGQGFLAVTADGTKYWFNRMAQTPATEHDHTWQIFNNSNPWDTNPPAAYTTGTLIRKRNTLYATRVQDRFGNSVTYTYTNAYNQPVKISSITASDGRSITFRYSGNVIDRVTSDGRNWDYHYTSGRLAGVTQPDGGHWTIAFSDFSKANIEYLADGTDTWRNCFRPGPIDALYSGPYVGTITHPSGAVGTFTAAPIVLARTNVPALCENYVSKTASNNYNDQSNDYAIFPIRWHSIALTGKQIAGPSLPLQSWTFSYSSAVSWFYPDGQTEPYKCDSLTCADPICVSDSCAGGRTKTTVVGPDGEWKRYSFGNSYRYNEGKLLKIEEGMDENTILRTTAKTYDLALSGQPYPVRVGGSQHPYTDGFTSEYPRPEISTVVSQQAVTFSRSVDTGCTAAGAFCLDNFLRPTKQTRSSSLGYSAVDTTTYYDHLNKWVLGQVATQTTNGIQTARTDYQLMTALPIRSYSFGVLTHTLTYDAYGSLATVKDGRNYITNVSDWYRGVPRLITYPNAQTEAATVSPMGEVLTTRDELGYINTYGYDPMGRLKIIKYPTGDSTAWADTTLPFLLMSGPEYGIPAGNWKQVVATGDGQTTTFYDAQWRPVLAITEDTANPASKSFVVNRYDAGGRLVFTSYPVGSLTTINDTLQGTTTEYDALGRAIKVMQDSELGMLTSTTEYLPGFVTRTTNPGLSQTTTSYQAFDTPDTSRPVLILAPENVTTIITRDVFGKPLSVTRAGSED